MKNIRARVAIAVFAALATATVAAASDPLTTTITTLDAGVFAAFNHCDQPGELQRHADYFDEGVEFYHDTGGVTWNRRDMIANTERNVCGKYRRQLVPDSIKVYPIKGYGAIEQGVHTFCQVDSGKCEGMADFVIIWHQDGARWRITRVLSYGHRSNTAAQ
ncbi:MAG: nuclear transport factor 2 family protein [Xanthomonadales bacterium]|nr:nuclear transport factor 2 family protein [Xanthomonadales bacterium]